MRALRALACGLAIGTGAAACVAGTSGSVFQVRISLSSGMPADGVCTSDAVSGAHGALVRVVCSTGQFVSIDPPPGQPLRPTHGGAYRFAFGPGLPRPAMATDLGAGIGMGTVTALRVLHANGGDGLIEMWVSF